MVHLTPADISDSAGALAILDGIRRRWPWVQHLFADGADEQQEFQVLPRRWVVERTFGWTTRWRRLVRAYEARLDVSGP